MSDSPLTQWSLVLRAAAAETDTARNALEQLCQTYWHPIYSHARGQGCSPHDAEDLTQGFFLHLLKNNGFTKIDPQLGNSRTFLRAGFNRYRINQWEHQSAKKRGGGCKSISIDQAKAEERLALEPINALTPDIIFDRQWALQTVEQAYLSLEHEYILSGKESLFNRLRTFLLITRDADEAALGIPVTYEVVAQEFGMTKDAIKVAVMRLRQRFVSYLYQRVSNTVASPGDVEGELRYLLDLLSQ